MAAKKVDLQAIAELKARTSLDIAVPLMSRVKLQKIWARYTDQGDHQTIWELFPVALVTHLEACFRACVEHLIDFGEPYLSRADHLAKNVGFDFQTAKALHGKSITLGTLVAHSLPFSDYAHIAGPMTHLLDQPFNDVLRQTCDPWDPENLDTKKKPIIEDIEETIVVVQRLFHVRHIVVHEVTDEPPFAEQELFKYYPATDRLIHATGEVVRSILNPNPALTQADMNQQAAEHLAEERKRLNVEFERLRLTMGEKHEEALKAIRESWDEFSESYADLCALDYEGGSIQPLIHRMAKARAHAVFRELLEESALE